jgi:hypothetical protein
VELLVFVRPLSLNELFYYLCVIREDLIIMQCTVVAMVLFVHAAHDSL